MGRPDIAGGNVIDKAGQGEGIENDSQIEAGSENNDSIVDEAGNAGLNDGSENKEVGENVDPNEGTPGEEESNPESGELENQSTDEQFTQMREEMRREIMEEVRREMDTLKPQEPEAPKDPWANMNEETWAKKEEEVGVNRNAIKFFTNQSMRVVDHVMAKLDERLAKFEKSDRIREISRQPGFSDASRYQKDIDEFLSSYHPRHHSNEDLIKRAVIYARGKNMKSSISKARNESERNRKISGQVKPPTSGANVKKASPAALTPMQRNMARNAGMSEDEYAKLKTKRSVFA